MAYLLKTQEVYRVPTEDAAIELIEKAKRDGCGDVVKYACDYHETKSKGEVVDFWYRVTLQRNFCDEKDPSSSFTINYEYED